MNQLSVGSFLVYSHEINGFREPSPDRKIVHPDDATDCTAATWKLGVAYEFQGDRQAARQAFTEAIKTSEAAGNLYIQILATTGLGIIQFAENKLYPSLNTVKVHTRNIYSKLIVNSRTQAVAKTKNLGLLTDS